jgi:hypothetical protein
MASLLNADDGVVSGSAGLKSTADSSGVLALQTNGTTAITVNASQNVGVGTSSPQSKLHISGANVSGYGQLRVNATDTAQMTLSVAETNYANMYADTTQLVFGTTASIPILFRTNSTERMRLDSAGNLGLGVSPSAWVAYKALQVGSTGGALSSSSSSDFEITTNAYYSGGWLSQGAGVASSRYRLLSGTHAWFNAPSGTAGNAITFTQAMTLDASGNLGLGNTSPQARFHSYAGATSQAGIFEANNAVALLSFVSNATSSYTRVQLGAAGNDMVLYTTGAERARIDSSGNFGIGTSSPATKLDVRGNVFIGTTASGDNVLAFGNTVGVGPLFGAPGSIQGNSFIVGESSNGSGYPGFLKFYTTIGGTVLERARIDSSGNFGIGTTSPSTYSAKLAVVSTSADTRISVIDDVANGRGGYLRSNYSDAVILGTTSGVRSIVLAPDNTERLRINTSGAFGLNGSNFGTSGQVLTSAGSGSPPTWATAGGGSWTYLSTVTASGAATADIESTFDSTYDMYAIVVTGLTPGNMTDGWYARLKVGGSYQTANYSYSQLYMISNSTTVSSRAAASGGFFPIGYAGDLNSFSSFVIYVPNPSSTSVKKSTYWTGFSQYSDLINTFMGSAMYTGSTSALTGVRIYAAGGNLTGKFRLYGIKNS